MMRRVLKYLNPNTRKFWDDKYRKSIETGLVRSDERHLLKFMHLFSNAQRIMDFGAGLGGNVRFLAHQLENREFLLVDHSRICLEYARDTLLGEKDDRGNAFSYHESLEQIPEQSVELILSIEVLEHITEYKQILESLWARITPGGALLISVPVKGIRDRNRQHVNKFTVGRMFRELCRYGEIVHVSPRTWSRRSGRLATAYFYVEKTC